MTAGTIAALNPQLAWYVARASGLIAWAVVTLSILWGLALSTRLVRRRGVPAWLLDLHKFLGTLAIVFVGVHVLALWADTYVYFGPRELFVPFASPWRTSAVAWGIAAMYLLIAIELSSWVMKRLPRRLWRSVHATSLPMFAAATVHGFMSGADRANLAVQWVATTGGVLVSVLLILRMGALRQAAAPESEQAPVPARRLPRSTREIADDSAAGGSRARSHGHALAQDRS
ncbi:MAG TPA: ferric reductase-like transmembrane domain-containing protein [Acidimicrobiia bacterium]|nr:ferric reductase-like transmembrane domain-containing protein [Acidimicrobiia bacterium]